MEAWESDVAQFIPSAEQGTKFNILVYDIGTIVQGSITRCEGLAVVVESNVFKCNVDNIEEYRESDGRISFRTADDKKYIIYIL